MKKIYFIRHGETNANANLTISGKDELLSDAGHQQAIKCAERIENLKIDKIYTSDFIRTQETAKPSSEVLRIPTEAKAFFGEMYEQLNLSALRT